MIPVDLSTVPALEPNIPNPDPATALPRAVQAALSELRNQDRGERSLTVVVNDPQRHTDTARVFGILARSEDLGQSRLVIATGTHTFDCDQRARFEHCLRAEAFDAVSWHDAHSCRLVALPGPGPWSAHPWVAEDGPVLAIGSVEPHYFAGLTGAHKTCTIGVACRDDIERNHALALDPASGPGRLTGNPVYEDIASMVATLESTAPLAGVNLLQAGPRVVSCAGGRVLESLREMADNAMATFSASIPQPADALILEVDRPLSDTMYQADKAIKNSEHAVRDGGTIVLVAQCGQGMGQDHFVQLLRQGTTLDRVRAIVRQRGYRLGDHKAVRLRDLTDPSSRGVRVWAVTAGLSEEDLQVLQFRRAASVGEAMKEASVNPSTQRVYRVRDAGNLVVRVSYQARNQ